eukprot:166780-Amphidinium_carterae.1
MATLPIGQLRRGVNLRPRLWLYVSTRLTTERLRSWLERWRRCWSLLMPEQAVDKISSVSSDWST